MNKKTFNLEHLVRAIVLTTVAGFLLYYNMNKKTILVLQSYNTDYAWVRDVDEGIKRAVAKENAGLNILYHYMDTKNHPDDPSKKKAAEIAKEIIRITKPNVVVSVDDDAQNFVMKEYNNDPSMVNVFAGVNAKAEKYGYTTATNVTGILERIPIEGIKEFVEVIAKQKGIKTPVRIAHVADDSKVVKSDDTNMHEYPNWAPMKFVKSQFANTFSEWKEIIKNADKSMDIMLISNYRKVYEDKEKKKLVPFKEVMKWAYENSPIPIIGINGFVTEDGAAISIGASPFEQGEVSMTMAIDIAKGRKKVGELPIQTAEQFIVLIHQGRLAEKFSNKGVVLPRIYEAFARATSKYIKDETTKK